MTAQTLGTSATQLYTSPGGTVTRIDKLTVINQDSASHTVTIYLVPVASTQGTANRTTNAQVVQAGQSWNSPNEYGHYLNAGDSVWAFASASSVMTIAVGGTQAS